ncbi:MAG: threonine synthase [Parvularculaceae bacterium]|nr:threonine synthase [Parvularculaceae bacterium]
MRFLSTRGRAPEIGFREAVLSGLAPDGGLYMPAAWPALPAEAIAEFPGRRFPDVAARILAEFAGPELSARDILAMAERAFAAFDPPEVAPLRPLGGEDHLLELFHGPTLAFKDIAMRMLAAFYDWALGGRARGKTIIGATSGDTGGAAVDAFAGSSNVEVFMLHPKGRVSDVQRRMMTTGRADNIVNIAVEGAFDDCQRIVKKLFADETLNSRLDLGGVNSINFVRLAIQTVYYFTAAAALGRPAAFIAPTGNFGDVFAGYAAKRMGLEIARLGVAVNANDIMRRVLTTGVYEPRTAVPTSSPSMDIEIASNFERLIFEAAGRDSRGVRALMGELEGTGRMVLPPAMLQEIGRDFRAESADEAEVASEIREIFKRTGALVDPHTAVGLVALRKLREKGAIKGPAVCLATAHPAKFPEAVRAASGVYPELPERLEGLMTREERMIAAPADPDAVRRLILERSRYVEGACG